MEIFKKFLSRRETVSIGLRISDDAISVFGLASGKPEIIIDKRVPLPIGIVKRGVIINREKLQAALETAFHGLPDTGKSYVINFSLPENLLYYLNFDVAAPGKIEKATELNLKKIPLPLEKIAYHAKPADNSPAGQKNKAFLFAWEESALSAWHDFFSDFGWPVKNFCLQGIGDFLAFFESMPAEPLAILDAGGDGAVLSIFSDQAFRFAVYFDNSFVRPADGEFLAKQVRTSIAEAEEYYGFELKELIICGQIINQPEFYAIFRQALLLPTREKELCFKNASHFQSETAAIGLSRFEQNNMPLELSGLSIRARSRFYGQPPELSGRLGKISRFFPFALPKFFFLFAGLAMIILPVLGLAFLPGEKQPLPLPRELPINPVQSQEIIFPVLALLSDKTQEGFLALRIIEVPVAEAMPREILKQKSLEAARKELAGGEMIISDSISLDEKAPLYFPCLSKHLVVKKSDIDEHLKKNYQDIDFQAIAFSDFSLEKDLNGWIFQIKIIGQAPVSRKIDPPALSWPAVWMARLKNRSSAINIRSGPGRNFLVAGKADPNKSYLVLLEQDGWAKVLDQDGFSGWISQDFLEMAEISQSRP